MSTTACLFYILFLGSSAMMMVERNMCSICKQPHLKETPHANPGALFAMKDHAYRICSAPLPMLNPITIRNHIFAYAVNNIKAHEMWEIEKVHPKVLLDGGNLVFTMAITLFDSSHKHEKICCRGLTRSKTDTDSIKKTMCGHTKCSQLDSKVKCEAWEEVSAPPSRLDFQPCLQLTQQETHRKEVTEVLVPPYSTDRKSRGPPKKKRNTVIKEGFNMMPCPHCVHGPHWCDICSEDHLKEVQLMDRKNEITANNKKYVIRTASSPHLNMNTLKDYISAYANSRVKREANEIWTVGKMQQDLHEGNLFVAIIMKSNTNPEHKMCCRAVGRTMSGVYQHQQGVKCGHPRCSAFESEEKCFGWKVEAKYLITAIFDNCLHMVDASRAHDTRSHPGSPSRSQTSLHGRSQQDLSGRSRVYLPSASQANFNLGPTNFQRSHDSLPRRSQTSLHNPSQGSLHASQTSLGEHKSTHKIIRFP